TLKRENALLLQKLAGMEAVVTSLSGENPAIIIAEAKEGRGTATLPVNLVEALEREPWKVDNETIMVKEWEWVGGWRIDNDVYGCDEEGWIYGDDAGKLRDNVGGPCPENRGERKIRKRNFERTRILKGYEGMGEGTREYLKVVMHGAMQAHMVTKLSDQILSLHTSLNQREEKLVHYEAVKKQNRTLAAELNAKKRELEVLLEETREFRNEQKVLGLTGGGSRGGSPMMSRDNSGNDLPSMGGGRIANPTAATAETLIVVSNPLDSCSFITPKMSGRKSNTVTFVKRKALVTVNAKPEISWNASLMTLSRGRRGSLTPSAISQVFSS
ncbi:hypothetical protein TrRE_jg228, partial [Triparma retinervis]